MKYIKYYSRFIKDVFLYNKIIYDLIFILIVVILFWLVFV